MLEPSVRRVWGQASDWLIEEELWSRGLPKFSFLLTVEWYTRSHRLRAFTKRVQITPSLLACRQGLSYSQ